MKNELFSPPRENNPSWFYEHVNKESYKKKTFKRRGYKKKEFMVNLKSFEGIFFWQCESDVENSYLIFLHFQSFTIFFPFLTRNFFFFWKKTRNFFFFWKKTRNFTCHNKKVLALKWIRSAVPKFSYVIFFLSSSYVIFFL